MATPIWRNRLTNGIFSRRVIGVCPGVALRLLETRLDSVCGRPAFRRRSLRWRKRTRSPTRVPRSSTTIAITPSPRRRNSSASACTMRHREHVLGQILRAVRHGGTPLCGRFCPPYSQGAQKRACRKRLAAKKLGKSGRHDLNMRPLRPERSALARLSYAPRESKLRILAIRPKRLNRNANGEIPPESLGGAGAAKKKQG